MKELQKYTAEELKKLLLTGMSYELKNLDLLLEQIENPEKKLDLISKFLPYLLPRLNAVDANIKEDTKGGVFKIGDQIINF